MTLNMVRGQKTGNAKTGKGFEYGRQSFGQFSVYFACRNEQIDGPAGSDGKPTKVWIPTNDLKMVIDLGVYPKVTLVATVDGKGSLVDILNNRESFDAAIARAVELWTGDGIDGQPSPYEVAQKQLDAYVAGDRPAAVVKPASAAQSVMAKMLKKAG